MDTYLTNPSYPNDVTLDALKKAQADMREIQLKAIMPVTLGTVVTFEAHGKQFCVKKVSGKTWALWHYLPDGQRPARMRFGSHDEIEEDVSYVLDIGALPPPPRMTP